MRNRSEHTICAVSTPLGTGGLAVIRISGPAALASCQKIAPSLKKKNIRSHHIYLAKIFDEQNEVLDEAIIAFYEKGRSFTGEEVVEISCHGSEYIAAKTIDLLIDAGCVLAEKGEFTFRAFMNDRLDLVQAESVLSLIESQSQASARVALRQLKGDVSKKFEEIESELTWSLAHIEASIDFSTEGIDVIDPAVLKQKLNDIRARLRDLVRSYRSGRLIKEGIKAVLLGKPNAGKSSLLNLIAQDEKAIVTPLAGTTRDIIQAQTLFNGLRFTISDTAGLRETTELVEMIGVDRSQKEANLADVVLYVLDSADTDWSEASSHIAKVKSPVLVLLNKTDLVPAAAQAQLRKNLQKMAPVLADSDVIFTSHVDPSSRDRVLTAIKNKIGDVNAIDEAMITSARQYEMAKLSLEMLDTTLAELEKNIGAEFVAMYLKESLVSVQRILGHVFDDQIMDRVFKEFCLGK